MENGGGGIRGSNINFDGFPDVLDGIEIRGPRWPGKEFDMCSSNHSDTIR